MLKDIFQQSNRSTQAALKRKRPELAPLVEAVEEWLVAAEEDTAGEPPPKPGANGAGGRGGSGL
jgi:hypothetical protein